MIGVDSPCAERRWVQESLIIGMKKNSHPLGVSEEDKSSAF
jgi:hypothetical protein